MIVFSAFGTNAFKVNFSFNGNKLVSYFYFTLYQNKCEWFSNSYSYDNTRSTVLSRMDGILSLLSSI